MAESGSVKGGAMSVAWVQVPVLTGSGACGLEQDRCLSGLMFYEASPRAQVQTLMGETLLNTLCTNSGHCCPCSGAR